MRNPKTTKNRVSVGLTSEEYEALRELAAQYEISMAWLGRRAIGEFLESHQNRELPLPFGRPGAQETSGRSGAGSELVDD